MVTSVVQQRDDLARALVKLLDEIRSGHLPCYHEQATLEEAFTALRAVTPHEGGPA